jgi:glycosyltransferase involved in cell wall biosynthesis
MQNSKDGVGLGMKIIYFANIGLDKTSGVSVVVPKHLSSVADHAEAFFVNLNNNLNSDSSSNASAKLGIDERVKVIDENEYESYQFDIAVFEEVFCSPKYLSISRNLRKKKIPYVIVPHGCLTKAALSKGRIKKLLALNTVMRGFINGAAAIQFLTPAEQKASILNEKAIIIKNGIEQCKLSVKDGRKSRQIVFIGRKDLFHKGLDMLLKACSIISNDIRKNKYTVKLYGPDFNGSRKKIARLIEEYNIRDIVFDLDPVFDEEKQNILMNSEIFILTSRSEGLPTSVLEAMVAGSAVIVTPGTNMASEINKNACGFVADATSLDIANCILRAIESDDLRRKYAIRAKTYVQDNYSWRDIGKSAFETYKTIAERGTL